MTRQYHPRAQEIVLDFMKEHAVTVPLHISEIARRMAYPVDTVNHALIRLTESGKLSRYARGMYQMIPVKQSTEEHAAEQDPAADVVRELIASIRELNTTIRECI